MTHLLQRIRSVHREESGQAMVEFAFVLPLLLVLILAVADFGRAFSYWLDATHLANMGARWAAVNRNFSGDPGCTFMVDGSPVVVAPGTLQGHIKCKAATNELKGNVVVTICTRDLDGNGVRVGDAIEVKVAWSDFPFKFIRVIQLMDDVDIEGKATMRLEALPPSSYAACS